MHLIRQQLWSLCNLKILLLLRLFISTQSQSITTKPQRYEVRIGDNVDLPCNLANLSNLILFYFK